MRRLTFFLAAVSLVLSAPKALCYATTSPFARDTFNSFKYDEIREDGPISRSIRRGRFLSVDPGSFDPEDPQSWNRYSYVRNNPINDTDPTGRERGVKYRPAPKMTPEGAREFRERVSRFVDGGANVLADVFVVVDLAAMAGGAGEGAAIEKLEADTEEVGAAFEEGAATTPRSTDFVVTPEGEAIPVPDGASGPKEPNTGSGMVYQGGSGGKGMDAKTTGVRIMDANKTQPQRVNYMNKTDQTVNPQTGRTISNSDPAGHVKLKPFSPTPPPPKKDPEP